MKVNWLTFLFRFRFLRYNQLLQEGSKLRIFSKGKVSGLSENGCDLPYLLHNFPAYEIDKIYVSAASDENLRLATSTLHVVKEIFYLVYLKT